MESKKPMRERTGSDNSYAKVRFPKSCNIFYSVIGPNEPVLEPEIEDDDELDLVDEESTNRRFFWEAAPAIVVGLDALRLRVRLKSCWIRVPLSPAMEMMEETPLCSFFLKKNLRI